MKRLAGIAASPGIAIGPAFVFRPATLAIRRERSDDPTAEWARFQSAAARALEELTTLRSKVSGETNEEEAAIFDAHAMILQDPELEADVRAGVDAGASAEVSVETAFRRAADTLGAMDDPMFRSRAADFTDTGRRLLRLLLGVSEDSFEGMTAPAIVVARDLLPSDTARMNRRLVRGFCTAEGGPLSHTAILARNLGLPAVVGAGAEVMHITDGQTVIVDGDTGALLLDPTSDELGDYEGRASRLAGARVAAEAAALDPAVTRDGCRVEVVANIGLPGEAAEARKSGAEGIGLLRTEFLFTDRETPPNEDEQVRAYREVIEAMGERPVVARTLDIGGDKPAAYLPIPPEANPFLGWRAIRIGLDRPDFLKTQLRALLRAGQGGNLKIMFPMIATPEEMDAARGLFETARAELIAAGVPHAERVEVGMMVEVPSAAVLADVFASRVDFFSIGSNDLTQYTLAADRGNAAVARLFDSLHPAVLRLVKQVIDAAHAAGKWVGMCGELAGEPAAIPILLGLGLDEFSMGAASIAPAKALVRSLSLAEARTLARRALECPNAPAVRSLVAEWMLSRSVS